MQYIADFTHIAQIYLDNTVRLVQVGAGTAGNEPQVVGIQKGFEYNSRSVPFSSVRFSQFSQFRQKLMNPSRGHVPVSQFSHMTGSACGYRLHPSGMQVGRSNGRSAARKVPTLVHSAGGTFSQSVQ